MIRRLRVKITLLAICSVAVVLTAIIGTANILNYRSMVREVDLILDILVEYDGAYPLRALPENDIPDNDIPENDVPENDIPENGALNNDISGNVMPDKNIFGGSASIESAPEGSMPIGDITERSTAEEGATEGSVPERDTTEEGVAERGSLAGDDDPKRRDELAGRVLTPETPYETRYFTVTFDEEENVTDINVDRIAAVDSDTAQEYAEKVLAGSSEKGFIESYRYLRQEKEGKTLVIFVDCSGSLSSFYAFLRASILVSIVGTLAVLILLSIFSGRIVAPFAESYEKQKQFITNAGHEIKTPLTIIEADAEIIELESGESEWVKDIHKQIVCLRDLTEYLIFLSKMEEKQKNINRIEIPISDVALETAQSFQALAKIQKKTFCFEIEPMLSYEGEVKSIQRLFSILLDNALKYSDPDGEIYFLLKKKNKNINIIVYNTAEQVDKEKLPHLFDRFYRADASRNSQTGGHGIGLSIAKAIVIAHEGKITASTSDGKSLTIHIVLS
ncbi:MAG: HAMP domain-containing histidine kinase [Clostridiales bacterium]|nr:HAMP domain-containing histidine kinase [Clostridiales bacterium]